MKNSKIVLVFVLTVMCGMAAMSMDFKVNGIYVKPGDDDAWDNAYGAEISGTYWINEYFGILGSIGFEKYEVNDEMREESGYDYDTGLIYGYAAQNKGDAQAFPVGVSGVSRIFLMEKLSLSAEIGIKYLFINSDVKIEDALVATDGRNHCRPIGAENGHTTPFPPLIYGAFS